MANEKRLDLIDRNALMKNKTVLWDEALGYSDCVLVEDIDNAPTVDAVEVVHGRWVWISDSVVSCSQCNRDFYSDDDVNAGITWFYCPNCGADMRERETEDDN